MPMGAAATAMSSQQYGQPGATHRRVPSEVTQASAIAESAMSYADTLATDDTFHLGNQLGHFPSPPPSVPVSPLRANFTNTPHGSHFNTTPRNSGVFAGQSHLRPLAGSPLGGRRRDNDASPPYTPTAISTQHAPSYDEATRSPSSRPLPTAPVVQPEARFSPQPAARYSPRGQDSPRTLASALSPYDWHEGSSSIGIDPREDRLLTTDFITDLLTSTESNPSVRGVPYMQNPRDEPNISIGRPFGGGDGTSVISEMTYPPPSRLTASPPLSEHNTYASNPSTVPLLRDNTARRPPPTAFIPRNFDEDGIEDAESLASSIHANQSAVIRTASTIRGARNLTTRGGNVIGVAPATLRHISESTDPSRSSRYQSGNINGTGSSHEYHSEYNHYRDSDDNQLPLPRMEAGQSMVLSPALPSTAGAHNSFATRRSKSVHSTKSTKSYVSSFITKITSVGAGVKAAGARSVRWVRKPLPPVPTLPHVPLDVQRQHQQEDDALPLPDLVDRAGTLSKMLENGYHPHYSMSEVPWDGPVSAAQSPKSAHALHASGTLLQGASWRGPTNNDKGFYHNSPVSPKVRAAPRSRRKRIIIFASVALAMILIVVIGTTVGTIEGKKRHSLPNCGGNLTGMSCSLGE